MFDIHKLITHIEKAILAFIAAFTVFGVGLEMFAVISSGKVELTDLLPGAYVVAAIDYVEEGMWNDPEYLDSIRTLGQRFTLGEADAHALMLKLSSPQ